MKSNGGRADEPLFKPVDVDLLAPRRGDQRAKHVNLESTENAELLSTRRSRLQQVTGKNQIQCQARQQRHVEGCKGAKRLCNRVSPSLGCLIQNALALSRTVCMISAPSLSSITGQTFSRTAAANPAIVSSGSSMYSIPAALAAST